MLDEVKSFLKAMGHDTYASDVEKAKRIIESVRHIVEIECMASNVKVEQIKEIINAKN